MKLIGLYYTNSRRFFNNQNKTADYTSIYVKNGPNLRIFKSADWIHIDMDLVFLKIWETLHVCKKKKFYLKKKYLEGFKFRWWWEASEEVGSHMRHDKQFDDGEASVGSLHLPTKVTKEGIKWWWWWMGSSVLTAPSAKPECKPSYLLNQQPQCCARVQEFLLSLQSQQ